MEGPSMLDPSDQGQPPAASGRPVPDAARDTPPPRPAGPGDAAGDDVPGGRPTSAHPYRSLPDKAFWRRSVAAPPMGEVDPVGRFDLRLTPETRVATAGSCFAQHIARHLRTSGFSYFVAEPGHPVIPEALRAAHGYGTFSARYGNVYTARQLRQLVERALGSFEPAEPAWVDPDGSVRDPFRPSIQSGNFVSVAEMEADRRQHLACVRRMLAELDVFVFTLGLTEAWLLREDGAAFPICPGVEGGTFDPERYEFRNFGVAEVVEDMEAALAALRAVNPRAEVVLTVSPIPLAATAVPGAHVLSATSYSKSVLRVAAQMLTDRHPFVSYFPSYEIITGAFNRGAYFASDLRNATEEGVGHVMRLFLAHATWPDASPGTSPGDPAAEVARPARRRPPPPEAPAPSAARRDASAEAAMAMAAEFVQVECDEAGLDLP